MAAILLVLTATAGARPLDSNASRPFQSRTAPAPTIIKETVVQPAGGAPSPIVFVLIGVGAGTALLGAGYLGARIALRTTTHPA
jgi:hypothetical protein